MASGVAGDVTRQRGPSGTATPEDVRCDVARWQGLVRCGAWAALAGVAMIVVQMGLYVVWPPPATVEEYFDLLLADPVRGAVALDALYVVSNLLAYLLYGALAVVLWRVSRSGAAVALAFGVLGMAAYLASPRPVEMLILARAYDEAAPAEQVALLATGEGMLATWMGTAFDLYYLLNLVTLVLLTVLMLRSTVFTRVTAWWGVAAAVLMAVPSNAGVVGLAFALASLVPWSVFSVLVWRRLRGLVAESTGPSTAPPHRR